MGIYLFKKFPKFLYNFPKKLFDLEILRSSRKNLKIFIFSYLIFKKKNYDNIGLSRYLFLLKTRKK